MAGTSTKAILIPTFDRVVIVPDDAEAVTPGGIVLPDAAQVKPARGTVEAVGRGKRLDDGSYAEPFIEEGDRVLYAKYAGTTVEVDGEDRVILREDDVLAVYRD